NNDDVNRDSKSREDNNEESRTSIQTPSQTPPRSPRRVETIHRPRLKSLPRNNLDSQDNIIDKKSTSIKRNGEISSRISHNSNNIYSKAQSQEDNNSTESKKIRPLS